MPLATNNLYSENTRAGLPAIQPAEGPGAVDKVAFAGVGVAGSVTLRPGTPVYVQVANGNYSVIDATAALGATNDIFGIVWPEAVVLPAAGTEVLGTIMIRGAVDFAVLEALRVAGAFGAATAAQLRDVCRKPTNRERGIRIENLDKLGTTTTGLA
jgi:hypothetical protein